MLRRYLPVLLMLWSASLPAAESITTLQLHHRQAVEIIPIIEPLLEPDARISGQGFKIFLRASAQTVDEVRELIASIDVAAKTLLISVFQGRRSDLDASHLSGSIRVENGNIDGSIAAGATQRSESGGPVHRLRVTEGSEGFIATGTEIALFSTGGASTGSGFYVLPRLNGDQVTLQISPFRNNARATGGKIETLQAATTISGRLGEWLPLGGVDERIERSRNDGVGQSSMKRTRQDSIWIRADLAR